jgi:hypothetical protein
VLTIYTHDFIYDIFVSYRHQEPDRSWVRDRLLPRLRVEGFEVVDLEPFLLGTPRLLDMARVVEQSRYVVAVLSPAYLEHSFTELENILAEHLGLEEIQRRLLLVCREPVRLPVRLRVLPMLDMTDDEQFESAFTRIVDQLRRPVELVGRKGPDDLSRPGRRLAFEVVEGDVTTFAADLIAFKYAQDFHGADWQAARTLARMGIEMEALQPEVGEYRLVDAGSVLRARQVLWRRCAAAPPVRVPADPRLRHLDHPHPVRPHPRLPSSGHDPAWTRHRVR